MTIQERAAGAVTILDIEGRLTIETVTEVRLVDIVQRLLERGRLQILLNLQAVPRLDTSGLRAIIEAYLVVRRRQGTLKLLHLSGHVHELMKVTKLLTVFEAYDAEADALTSFAYRELFAGAPTATR